MSEILVSQERGCDDEIDDDTSLSSLIVTGRSKGYAFIEYKHKEDADYAWEVKNSCC